MWRFIPSCCWTINILNPSLIRDNSCNSRHLFPSLTRTVPTHLSLTQCLLQACYKWWTRILPINANLFKPCPPSHNLRVFPLAAQLLDRFEAGKAFLSEEPASGDNAQRTRQLGLTPKAVGVAVCRMRQRCRHLVRMMVADTLADAEDVDRDFGTSSLESRVLRRAPFCGRSRRHWRKIKPKPRSGPLVRAHLK